MDLWFRCESRCGCLISFWFKDWWKVDRLAADDLLQDFWPNNNFHLGAELRQATMLEF